MDEAEFKKLCKKHRITARKYMGDDQYSWAVFANGSPKFTGLGQREVKYYKTLTIEILEGR